MSTNPPMPKLSIVIASLNGRPYIDACLAALARQQGNIQAEVLVAECVGPEVVSFIKSNYPDVKGIAFAERKSVPQLRAAGILAARGEIIAITEDHCIPADNWYTALVTAHTEESNPAIAGPVDNAPPAPTITLPSYSSRYTNLFIPV